jgi:hypothetical protein
MGQALLGAMTTSFKQFLIETVLRTQKGSPIKRSKFGVGKDIGGFLYLHKMYVSILPQEMQKAVLAAENAVYEKIGRHFEYNTVKVSKDHDSVTLVQSPDFDTSPEPMVGDFAMVKVSNGLVKFGNAKSIWHHKWLWVKDDYPGFDVEESINRSKEWLQHDVDFSRIGNKKYWDKHHASKLK